MEISVIIPAKNEAQYISDTLKNVVKQKPSEIIVVCDACTDKTAHVAKKFTKKVYSVSYNNVSKARNFGVTKAKGNILVFLDADTHMSSQLLKRVKQETKFSVGGTCKTTSREKNVKARFMWFIGHLCNYIFLTASGFMFCKKDAFSKYRVDKKVAEDTYFLLALEKKGRVSYISDEYVMTSMRRFEKKGYFRTILTTFRGFFFKNFNEYEVVR